MPVEVPFGAVLSVAWAILLLLVAAKAHGRQLRVERERAGFHDVRFGGDNPAWVEALWARDRRGFWAIGLAAAALLVGGVLVGAAVPLPLARTATWPVQGCVALAAAATLAFTVQGLRAWRRAASAGGVPRAAQRGSEAWWGLVGGLGAAWLLVAWA